MNHVPLRPTRRHEPHWLLLLRLLRGLRHIIDALRQQRRRRSQTRLRVRVAPLSRARRLRRRHLRFSNFAPSHFQTSALAPAATPSLRTSTRVRRRHLWRALARDLGGGAGRGGAARLLLLLLESCASRLRVRLRQPCPATVILPYFSDCFARHWSQSPGKLVN